MRLSKSDLLAVIFIIIISILTVFDLFVNSGRPATMDGLTHITTIEQFTLALRDGDFPVRWLNGFANYGLPLGSIVHQMPSYLGSIINFFLNDPVLSFNIVSFIGIALSSLFFYIFLRIYAPAQLAFLGIFIFNLAPYRILNLYIRGAIPETFSAVFPPLIMISLYLFFKKKDFNGLLLFTFSFVGLILTHPMMLVVYFPLLFFYFIFLLITEEDNKYILKKILSKKSMGIAIATILGLGISSYYLIPLILETKYLYYGSEKNHLVLNYFMSYGNFFDPYWHYFTNSEIFTRGHDIKSGIPEIVIFLVGVLVALIRRLRRGIDSRVTLLDYAVITGILTLLMMLTLSQQLYLSLSFLGNIQFPWRFFSSFIFIPPLIIVLILRKIRFQNTIIFILIVLLACRRFPQLYGKNYTSYKKSEYVFTKENLHSTSLNTIWSGETNTYPIKSKQAEIVGGNGEIISAKLHNSHRTYQVTGATDLRLVDFTFFFPGWHVYVDRNEVPIQFQDPNYRGVITYEVPKGEHTVEVEFENTKVRFLGNIISALSLVFLIIIILQRRKIYKLLL